MTALANRYMVRSDFGALLKAALEGPAKTFEKVYDYMPNDFKGLHLVGVLGPAGTERVPLVGHSGSYPNYLINFWSFVLYAKVDNDGNLVRDPVTEEPEWDEQDSEQKQEEIEAEVRAFVDANQQADKWETIEYAGATVPELVTIGTQDYRREQIPLRFRTM